MNKTPDEAVKLVNELKPLIADADAEVVICPPFVCLPAVAEAIKGTNMKLGAQNMHWEESGAYTGEVSPVMLKALGVEYVIIGHSERRQYFAETDETVNKKVISAFEHGLKPIVCVGETLEQRERGVTFNLVKTQTFKAFEGIKSADMENAVIAYEPIWAIGTGRNATADDANEVIVAIRNTVKEMFGNDVASKVRIQYGGSVKPDNIKDFMNMDDIDGALVGGASLTADSFAKIVKY
ncbi:triosephosphate isomerase [Caldanaerobius fijiensis DSM 17918]|uniref:Triosephosphate isomerase n=2 Tax=Caldanaerobius TaxID=862261 RepID=A0A1M5CT87_9THEO|nr:triosephosphate isomerase [Caldanaerobius fijiensis DSM 17918]